MDFVEKTSMDWSILELAEETMDRVKSKHGLMNTRACHKTVHLLENTHGFKNTRSIDVEDRSWQNACPTHESFVRAWPTAFLSPEAAILLVSTENHDLWPNLVPRAFSSTIFKMADRREKTLGKAELTPLLIGPFIRTRWLAKIHP